MPASIAERGYCKPIAVGIGCKYSKKYADKSTERVGWTDCTWHWLQPGRPLNCLGGELSKAPRFQIEKPSFTANRNVPVVEGFANKDLSNQKLKLYAIFLYNADKGNGLWAQWGWAVKIISKADKEMGCHQLAALQWWSCDLGKFEILTPR